MGRITKEQAEKILEQVAVKNGVTVDEVRKEIQQAMLAGMKSESPEAQRQWGELNRGDHLPSPEELIMYLTGKL